MSDARTDPPVGEVALVFTDIQGSTRLWERFAESMRAALDLHNELLRVLIFEERGYEVKTEGDAFMVAFREPLDAARFCVRAQEALLAAPWPSEMQLGNGLLVRMGIHSGEPECRIDPTTGRMDYFGPIVNRAARISAAGHGGQILVSERVMKAVDGKLDAVVSDLGEHRLKDIEHAERLFQLLPKALASRTFPALRTLDVKKTNLNPHPTAFVGREADLAAVHEVFSKGDRFVTLMGPGGTGKTRLSMRYAAVHLEEFTRDGGGGAWFCDLTEARDVAGVCASVGAALDVPLVAGKTAADMVDQLGHAISGRGRVLLVLDNFEQVVSHAPATVGRWMSIAPHARFLVSSQERLRLPGEQIYELHPLVENESVALFVERARAVRRSFVLTDAEAPTVAEIVKALDGIPLAIELAASRMGVLSAAKILERLPRRFDLLGGARRDASSRQSTLRGAIDWSWNLLQPHEQDALAQCSVFSGGFTVESAEEVLDLSHHANAPWPLDVVQSLRDKSLLRAWEPADLPGELRFGMYANIREYAAEKLQKREPIEARHRDHYLRVAAEWAEKVESQGGVDALKRLAAELENLHAILERAVKAGDAASALRAAREMDPVLSTRGPFASQLEWLDQALRLGPAGLAQDERGEHDALRGRVLELRGRARRLRGLAAPAREDLDAALAIARACADVSAEARVLGETGRLAYETGQLDESAKLLDEGIALARKASDARAEALLLLWLGSVYVDQGRYADAGKTWDATLQLARKVGNRRLEGMTLGNLGIVARREQKLDEAITFQKQALVLFDEIGEKRFAGNALGSIAGVLMERDDVVNARANYERALRIQSDVGNARSHAILAGNLGILEHLQGRIGEAQARYLEALRACRDVGDKRSEGLYLAFLAAAESAQGKLTEAESSFAAARTLVQNEEIFGAVVDVLEGALDLSKAAKTPAMSAEHRAAAKARLEKAEPFAAKSEDVRLAMRILRRSLDS